ncbi:MAG: T9SS type A sorting domain-containing protein [Candidatus Kapaibacterium sp.]
MKTLLKILLLLLPSLCVAQYNDAQWIWSDYKMDFRRNNDSVVVFHGKMHILEKYTIGIYDMVNYNYRNGDLFLHINRDSTWINDSVLSSLEHTDYYNFYNPRITDPNGFESDEYAVRQFSGFQPLDSENIRLYRIFYERYKYEGFHGILTYDDIRLDRNQQRIRHKFKFGIDSISDFTIMSHSEPSKHWIVGHNASKRMLNIYLAGKDGVDTVPKSSFNLEENGLDFAQGLQPFYFEFKPSPDGRKLLALNWVAQGPEVYLFTFDKKNGKLDYVTNFKYVDDRVMLNYDILFNFSPNSRYIFTQANKKLFQYDIADLDPIRIIESETIVAELDTNMNIYNRGGASNLGTNLLNGLNGKMYYRNPQYSRTHPNPEIAYQYFSIINRPDKKGTKADFKLKELQFDYHIIVPGVGPSKPRVDVIWNRLQTPSQMIGRTVSYCEGEDAYLNNVWEDRFVGTNFKWELLNLESNDTLLAAEINKYFAENPDIKDPFFPDATHNYEGKYYITWTDTLGYNRERIVNLYVDTLPKVGIVSTKLTGDCERERYRLEARNIIERYEYKWSTGETSPIIEVDKAGNYTLYVTSFQGCVDSSSINIEFEDEELYLEILGGNKLCYGGELTLSANQDYISYLWNTEETSKSIYINETGRYILTVETSKGCTVSDTIDITYHPKVQAQLKPTPTTICQGDSTLLESKYDVPYYSYEWNTGATTKSIYVSVSGNYKLIITDTKTGCKDSTEITIKIEDNLQPKIDGSNICSGQSATLTALPNDPSYTYLWSNGESTPVIVVSQAGTYSVTVSKAGCVGTAETTVKESPTPTFEIQGESIICNNETATLTSDKDFAEYLWSTNEITKEIEVTEAGTYTLTVTDENGCTATETHKVDKYELNFDISKGNIDVGKVYITETKSESVEIVNNSGVDVVFEAGTNFIKVFDGQTYKIDYPFIPTQLGAYNDEIALKVTAPCDTVITIPITATVYARTTISTEDIYTQIGQTETVPVYLECEAGLPTQEYTITTEIDRFAFFTNDSYTINQTQAINQSRTNIHNLTGTILLSDDLEYDITFPSYTFTNPYIEVVEQPGKIYIDSVCVFPLRNITTFDPTTLDISPNPASEQLNIDITTGVQGTMKLELVATDGRVIYTDEWTQLTRTKQMMINTLAIPSGLYQVRLITPYDAITKNVVVVE